MELYQLRTFVTVAEEAHLTRASERLHTSQPAISAHIKALEEELGVSLFERTPKGMRLTAAGRQLLSRARQTLDSAADLLAQARGLQRELVGSLRLGLNSDAAFLRLTELHKTLSTRHPRLEIHLLAGASHTNLSDLRSGKLDAAFVFGEVPDAQMACIELTRTRLQVAVPAAWRQRVEGMTASEITHLPWIYTSPDCAFFQAAKALFEAHRCCLPPQCVLSDDEQTLRSLVRAEVGVAIMREDEIAQAEIEGYAFAWPGELISLPLQLVYLQRRSADPVLRALGLAIQAVWALPESDDAAQRAAG